MSSRSGRPSKSSAVAQRPAAGYDPVLSPEQIAQLKVTGEAGTFRGRPNTSASASKPTGSASLTNTTHISRSRSPASILFHQLEAVYGYFLKLPRIRFLLADDPGAGKTIMAGLLLKELKARGLVQRTLSSPPPIFRSNGNER